MAAGVDVALVAEVDGDLDLTLPVRAGAIDLLDEEQARAEQGEADRHHDDECHGHGEVPAQPDPDLLEHEVRTHTGLISSLVSHVPSIEAPGKRAVITRLPSKPGRRRRGSGRGPPCRTQARLRACAWSRRWRRRGWP